MFEGELGELRIEEELGVALRAGELDLHYQPIRATDDLALVAYEALIRWQHPVRGMVAPSGLIPVAERTPLIHDLGLRVVRRACRDLAALGTRYVGMNVSAAQLGRADFAPRFARVLARQSVDPAQVTVEITETVALRADGGTQRRNLHALRDLGSWLAIDDFGAGYARLDHLDELPFNCLKIDKTLVAALGASREAFRFVVSLCDLGRRKNVVVVAEGVETEEQFALLRQAGCSRAQGYLPGRPAPVGIRADHDAQLRWNSP